MTGDPLQRAAVAAGVATAASGLSLVAAPRLALALMGAARPDPAPFLFRVVGMFMTVSGGALADAARTERPAPVALRWALATKVGATIMVTAGVRSRRFGRRALALAVIDGASAALVGAVLARRRS